MRLVLTVGALAVGLAGACVGLRAQRERPELVRQTMVTMLRCQVDCQVRGAALGTFDPMDDGVTCVCLGEVEVCDDPRTVVAEAR